jgi:hypothetical protein
VSEIVRVPTRWEGIYAISSNISSNYWIVEWHDKRRDVCYHLHRDLEWKRDFYISKNVETVFWPSERAAKDSLWKMKSIPPGFAGKVRSATIHERGIDLVMHGNWGRIYRCL